MNKYSYFDLVLKFIKEKNTKNFWDELNEIIKSHNLYFRKLDLVQRIKLASETSISSIKNQEYKSFEELRNGIILFSTDTEVLSDDMELLMLVLKRCNTIYSFKLNIDVDDDKQIKNDSDEDFINFIKKIDYLVNNLNYDEIFTKPYFFVKPDDENIENYINKTEPIMHFSKNSDYLKINKELNILADKKKSSGELDDFAQKKKFYDLNTEFISRDEIFVDNNQKLIFKYQYLINSSFNKLIDEYKKRNKLNEEDIYFIYKGGTFMKIIYLKYENLFKNNTDFFKELLPYFKRSDSDYSLLINPNFDRKTYINHYYWMNIMSYNLLTKITEFIDNNLSQILPIDKLSNDTLKSQLKKINKFLWDDRNKYNIEKQNILTLFNGVKEFIGIKINNNLYIKENFPPKFNLKKISSTSLSDNDIIEINHEYIDKYEYMKKYNDIPVKRDPFYITSKKMDKNIYNPVLCYIKGKSHESGIYQYFNESNRFKAPYFDSLNNFSLHRIKLNIVLYFKTFSKYETDVEYGFFQCPSELIDISITTPDDFKTNIDFSKSIQIYENTIKNNDLLFYSYTLYGIIEDILKQLFNEYEFPWEDQKYDKKIYRLFFFFFIYLSTSYKNFENIKENLINFFNNYKYDKNKESFIMNNGTVIKDDIIYYKILDKLQNLHERVLKNKNDENTNGIDKIKEIILNNLKLFNPKNIIDKDSELGLEYVPYLKKYLKYKQKYLAIKNK